MDHIPRPSTVPNINPQPPVQVTMASHLDHYNSSLTWIPASSALVLLPPILNIGVRVSILKPKTHNAMYLLKDLQQLPTELRVSYKAMGDLPLHYKAIWFLPLLWSSVTTFSLFHYIATLASIPLQVFAFSLGLMSPVFLVTYHVCSLIIDEDYKLDQS